MSELSPSLPESAGGEPLLDTLLREAVPEIKLALGDLIDRENQRAIPDRYVKLLPEQTLVVTLRPDAAEAMQPVAPELERELSDSCMRHGSLYDRGYRVKLRVAPSPGAPLFRVAARRGDEPEPEPFQLRKPEPAPTPAPMASPAPPTAADATRVAAAEPDNATVVAPRPAEPAPREPFVDPDATRLDGLAPVAADEPAFPAGRFELQVESEEGEVRERFPLRAALTTLGRETDNPELRSDLAIHDAPHVSRRQLALAWAPEGDTPAFTVYNLGLNPVHIGEREVPGANRGRGELRLQELGEDHSARVAPGDTLVVGEHGPALRIVDARPAEAAPAAEAEVEMDPDATRFG